MLRTLLMLFLSMASSFAHAGCGGGLAGHAGSYRFYIGVGDCEYAQQMIVVTNKRDGTAQTFAFEPGCRYTYKGSGPATGFTCKSRATSPLAGSKYVLRRNAKQRNSCGHSPRFFYACVQGCSSSIPSTFELDPEECDGGH